MKKLTLLLLVIVPVFLTNAQQLYFTSTGGQMPGNILSIDADSSDNLFTTTSQGKIFRSSDNGVNWQSLYQTDFFLIPKLNVISNQEIFAFGTVNQILYSLDGGNNWELRGTGIKPFDDVLTITRTQSGKLLSGAKTDCLSCDGGGIYSSTDNGQTWIFVDLLNNYINSIITGFNNKIMAAGGGGVFVSTDDGVSWQLKNSGMQPYEFIKYLTLSDDSSIFATTEMYGGLMYKSMDEGETWIECNSGLPNDEVSGLESINNILFVSYKNAGIYRSTNSGTNWELISLQIPNFEFNALSKTTDGKILSATSGGVFYSQNLGADWIKPNNSITHLEITSINFTNNSNLFVGTNNGGIFRSTDRGQNWEQYELINTDNGYDVNGIEYHSDNNIYASVHGYVINKSLFVSTNSGNSWSHIGVGNNTQYGLTTLYIDQTDKIYCGEFSKFFWTTNAGVQWVNQPCSFSWIKDMVSNGNGIVLAGTYGNGIYRSTNNGIGFIESGLANSNVRAVAVDKLGVFYAGSEGLYKSTDNGVTWIEIIPPSTISTVYDIKVSNNNIILAAGRGLFISSDDGVTWQSVQSGVENTYLTCISLDSLDNVYVGSNNGVYLLNEPVPVEFLTLSFSVIDNVVTLNWATATETNNFGFNVERKQVFSQQSAVGNEEWEIVSFINGHGTTTEIKSYSFKDENLSAGKYQYRLKQIDFDGTFEYSKIIEAEILPPLKFSLEQNYPNPFNPSTSIQYTIPSRQFVSLKIFNALGEEIATLVNEEKSAGNHTIEFKPESSIKNLVSGVYLYQLKAGEFIQTRKMILLK